MANKSHLKFLSDRQLPEVTDFKYNPGFGDDNKNKKEPDYSFMARSFSADLRRFSKDRDEKYELKDKTLEIPYDIDYIEITFQNIFAIDKTWRHYRENFGLEAVSFYDFAKKGLFAIVERDKFEGFIKEIRKFVDRVLDGNTDIRYSNYLKFISSFQLLRADDILKFDVNYIGDKVYLSLIELPLFEMKIRNEILNTLHTYLENKNIFYRFNEEENRFELENPTPEQMEKIVQNFDIIESATCAAFSTVRPGEVNTIQRRSGFEIANVDADLPIIGIIDTGIAQQSPLAPIIIKDKSFTLVGDPLIDHGGRNRLGHGTAVAGLSALGKENHRDNFDGKVMADAKLLSIKISNSGNGYISELELINMLYKVKEKYPEIRLFTLTTCYETFKFKNEAFSDYTYSLDKFAYETNSLIFISSGNNNNCINEISNYNLSYFGQERTNICTPADSMNNFTVGAAADNLRTDSFMGISSGREFPAIYTRKGCIDLLPIYGERKTNKNYFKPDVIESGGDIGFNNNGQPDYTDPPALTIISARPEMGELKEVGSSYSAPLVANLAAKIIGQYPDLSNESIKALIINGASLDAIKFPDSHKNLLNKVAGHGYVNRMKSLYSNEDEVTIILEDKIQSGKIRVYPIHFPKYLTEENYATQQKRLRITATLCFKFLPIKHNQLSYNPLHMAFSIFKNQSAGDIMKPEEEQKSLLRSTLRWSENGRYKQKPLPYSNTQKIILKEVKLRDLVSEDNTFKLAVHAKLTEQIVGGLPDDYPNEFSFSIVLTIEETPVDKKGKLYDEIKLVNHLEAVHEIELDADLDLEASV